MFLFFFCKRNNPIRQKLAIEPSNALEEKEKVKGEEEGRKKRGVNGEESVALEGSTIEGLGGGVSGRGRTMIGWE